MPRRSTLLPIARCCCGRECEILDPASLSLSRLDPENGVPDVDVIMWYPTPPRSKLRLLSPSCSDENSGGTAYQFTDPLALVGIGIESSFFFQNYQRLPRVDE